MPLFDYQKSSDLASQDVPFDALIMAAMRKADTKNLIMLKYYWPDLWAELSARYNAPGGVLAIDRQGER